jgi:hypothetical protein
MKATYKIACMAGVMLTASLMPVLPLLAKQAGEDPAAFANYKRSSLFAAQVDDVRQALDAQMVMPLAVPAPRDAGGGYTHEQHKRNYQSIYDAGRIFAITGEQKYADFAKRLLLAYADMYPTLGEHPKKKEQSPGRLFWQSLNEAVWLVVSIQGYEAIRTALTDAERTHIEDNLLRSMASFLSDGQPEVFNKIHNHGTWATAAVGMTGYVLGDKALVGKALYGLDQSGRGGFLRQLDELFSPTGYYSEGPYYQRYALMPFVLFAAAIEKHEPERAIFQHRDGILLKAIHTAIDLSYGNFFFPINDALKDKGLNTVELMHAVSVAYDLTGDDSLLSIAKLQSRLPLTAAGIKVAKALEEGTARQRPVRSQLHLDGASGDEGALAVLRAGVGPGHQALVVKNTAQGMGHGHFDKLSWLFYDAGHEIVRDYGAARFLNVEAKYGGHYLPENNSYAKQTIAHNTLVVDETSHFGGDVRVAEGLHPTQLAFGGSQVAQISVARMQGAYPGVVMQRAMALISDDALDFPFVLDVFRAQADRAHQYDLPVHFSGHLIDAGFPLEAHSKAQAPLGSSNGYQHLWLTAEGVMPDHGTARLTLLNDKRFYSLNILAPAGSKLLFTRTGANDPHFNLRIEDAVITRVPSAKDAVIVSVFEPHGRYNPAQEFTRNSQSQIKAVNHVSAGGKDLVTIETAHGDRWTVALSWEADPAVRHELSVGDGQVIGWKGPYVVLPPEKAGAQVGVKKGEDND